MDYMMWCQFKKELVDMGMNLGLQLGKKDYKVPLSDGTSTILKGVTVKVAESVTQMPFSLQVEKDARGGDLSTNKDGNLQVTYQDVIWKIRPISYKRISYT